jgi:membrane associated rhomboid family serine protease
MEADSSAVHRLNTYPLLHNGLLHTLANLLALTPLLERFESEHGTLVTVIMFTGRMWPIKHITALALT